MSLTPPAMKLTLQFASVVVFAKWEDACFGVSSPAVEMTDESLN